MLLILAGLVLAPLFVNSQSEVIYNMIDHQWGGGDGDLWLQIQLREISNDLDGNLDKLIISIILSKALDIAEMEIDYILKITYYYSNPLISEEWRILDSIQETGTLESLEIHFQFNDTFIAGREGNYWVQIEISTDSFVNREQNDGTGVNGKFNWISNELNEYPVTGNPPLETKIWYKSQQTGDDNILAKESETELLIPSVVYWLSGIFVVLTILFLGRNKIKSLIRRNSDSSTIQ